MTSISPKVLIPTAISVAAGALLWLVTGDKTALIVSLTGLVGGGIGVTVPPALGVSQRQVHRVGQRQRGK